MSYENLEDGFYNVYSEKEKKPTLVHLYYSSDAQCKGLGFNTHDGGGFLPLSDLTKDTDLVPVIITEDNDG
jgi:hypothetical protein